MLHIKVNGIKKYSNMVASILHADPRPPTHLTKGMGSIGKNLTFSEQGYVAYQIKENHECSNMVPNILPADPPPPLPPNLNMGLIGQSATV